MEKMMVTSLRDCAIAGQRVLLRLDINSPIDPLTHRIVNDNRLVKSLPTLRWLQQGGARTAIIAHQGDTLDYQNLIPLAEHAERLSTLLGSAVRYIDDVCGPAAVAAVRALQPGDVILLGNLRYLGEELSTFEKDVKLQPDQMLQTWLVRSLAPLFDLYVNDAFSAAHRNAPSMTAFQQVLPSAAGFLFSEEYAALYAVLHQAQKPCVFILGGAKISDAFGMMARVLANGTADRILTTGLVGQVFLLADQVDLGDLTRQFLRERDLLPFVDAARDLLQTYPEVIDRPVDLAYDQDGRRCETELAALPAKQLYLDIGARTIRQYQAIIAQAGTIFANGPAGVYEKPQFAIGTRQVWQAVADSTAYSVIGGGDTVSSASRMIDLKQISCVCTAGGAMIRFMSGKKLPLVEAMEMAANRPGQKEREQHE